MRAWILPLLLVTLSASSACLAEDVKPPMDLAVYPGSETMMEVNLSAEDIQPMIQATLPLLTHGGGAHSLNPDDLTAALKDVKRIEYVQLDLDKPRTTLQMVADYYIRNIPDGKWSRVYYTSSADSTLAVYASPALDSYYGFRARTKTIDGRQTKEIDVAKLVGKIDFSKLLSLAAKYMFEPPPSPAQGTASVK